MSPPIYTPDGSEVSEIVLPDGSTASQVIGPDGNVVFEAAPDIPDSVVIQHTATGYSQGDSTVPDDVASDGSQDLSLNESIPEATLSDGSDSIQFDDDSQFGAVTLPSEFEGASLNSWTLEIAAQFDSTRGRWGIANSNGQMIRIGWNANANFNDENGQFYFELADSDDSTVQCEPSSNPNIDDGNRHDISFSVHDAANNDVDIIIDGANQTLNFAQTGNPDNFGTWGGDMLYNAFNNLAAGGIIDYQKSNVGAVRWHNTAIGSQTIGGYPF